VNEPVSLENGETEDPVIPEAAREPGPDDPPWNSIIAFLFWVFSVLLITVVPLFFLIPYLGPEGMKKGNQKALENSIYSDPSAVLLALAGTFAAHLITLVCAWLVVTKMNRFSFRKVLGWKWGGFKLWHGAVIFFGVYGLALALNQILGGQDNDMMKILRSSRSAVIAVAIIATFSAPIVEEIVYRGILYSAFQRSLGVPAAVSAVTLIFAMVHVAQYYPDTATILSILVLSLILTVIRARTENLLPCIFFHFIFNGVQSLLLVLGPALPDAIDPTSAQSLILW
jgi:membrane protease YdiL (CAAX protease family)